MHSDDTPQTQPPTQRSTLFVSPPHTTYLSLLQTTMLSKGTLQLAHCDHISQHSHQKTNHPFYFCFGFSALFKTFKRFPQSKGYTYDFSYLFSISWLYMLGVRQKASKNNFNFLFSSDMSLSIFV